MSDASILPGGPRVGPSRRGRASARGFAFSAARGAGLIGLAVILGIVLLQVIDDGTSGPIGDGGNGSAGTATTTTTSGTGSSTTSTTSAVQDPSQVVVLVLNGSGAPGAATQMTNKLKSQGYQTLTPADAASREGTVVYYKAGLDRECAAVATAVGGNPTVEAIPDPPPTGSDNASCVVILGT